MYSFNKHVQTFCGIGSVYKNGRRKTTRLFVPMQGFPCQGQQWVYPLQRLVHALYLVTLFSSPKALSEFLSL